MIFGLSGEKETKEASAESAVCRLQIIIRIGAEGCADIAG